MYILPCLTRYIYRHIRNSRHHQHMTHQKSVRSDLYPFSRVVRSIKSINYQMPISLSPLEMCVQWEILLGGASFVGGAGQHTFCWHSAITRLLYVNISVYIFRKGPYRLDLFCYWKKHEHLWKNKTSQCWGHHPALTTNISTSIWPIEETVVTRQTYDRAPRLTRPPTAHISRGVYTEMSKTIECLKYMLYGFILTYMVKKNKHMYVVLIIQN